MSCGTGCNCQGPCGCRPIVVPSQITEAHLCDQVAPYLYQGGASAPSRGYALVALCAAEHQPPDSLFHGARVLRVPLRDRQPTDAEVVLAFRAARVVAEAVRDRRPCLVTCYQGLNRSGLVTALSLVLMGHSGDWAIRQVQFRRTGALFNRHFQEVVREVCRQRRQQAAGAAR